MYEFIEGKTTEINPAYVVLDCSGIGYMIHISLSTFSQIQHEKNVKLFIHFVVREDAHLLFGFHNKYERDVFRHLISVSGIGSNTARMMLSSLTPAEIQKAIVSENVNLLKSIKGIGVKSAQRLIVELKDKLVKEQPHDELIFVKDNTIKEEALSALVMLGFNKLAVEKMIGLILSENQSITVEELIKQALKRL
ncbi:MAG: Holliday junction branch migration protein RuvA [Bacteroidales bacterium]|nr:Holliday junction branch migration protein RuvA [Bacteroidales bacterium]